MQNICYEVSVNGIIPYLNGIDLFNYLVCCKRYYKVWKGMVRDITEKSGDEENDDMIKTVYQCFRCNHPVLNSYSDKIIIDVCNKKCWGLTLRCNKCLGVIWSKNRIIHYVLNNKVFYCSDECEEMNEVEKSLKNEKII